jgi:tRNA (guanine37-N1)-methyltransferase
VEINIVSLRDFAKDKYGSVDDSPYGGGTGMVLRADILNDALDSVILEGVERPIGSRKGDSIASLQNDKKKIILTSAKGKPYAQEKAKEFSKLPHLVIVAGHYEGVDERILDEIDEEVSLGDFVMTGGEIAAAAIADSVVRLIPGVLKKDDATVIESFFKTPIDALIKIVGEHETLTALKEKGITEVRLLEYPHYTRPEEFEGKKVPEILLSGDHKKINGWRLRKAFEETLTKRPDLLQ